MDGRSTKAEPEQIQPSEPDTPQKPERSTPGETAQSGSPETDKQDNSATDIVKESKRDFLKFFLFGGAATALGATLFELFKFFRPVPTNKFVLPKSVTLEKKVTDIPKNSGFIFEFGYRPALLIRTENGTLKAFFAECTHLACTVQYDAKHHRIICPCHEGFFNLSGKVIEGPPPEPLTELIAKASASEITIGRPGAKKK